MVIGVENGCQVYDISLHQIVKRCLTSLWIISTSSDLNIVFQVHSAAVISKPHIYFQDMYNIDIFIASCKTNHYYAFQTLNSKFYFLHNSPANFESYAKNHYAKLCKKWVTSPPWARGMVGAWLGQER